LAIYNHVSTLNDTLTAIYTEIGVDWLIGGYFHGRTEMQWPKKRGQTMVDKIVHRKSKM
jgi:hypothetical protein